MQLNNEDNTVRTVSVGLPAKNQGSLGGCKFGAKLIVSQDTAENYILRMTDDELQVQREADEKKQDIEENPQDYFNFGFSLQDFKVYLQIMYQKRVSRMFVEHKSFDALKEFYRKRQELRSKTQVSNLQKQ